MNELAGLLGGGSGLGVSPSSATSQASPFYNQAGINFGGEVGGVSGSPLNASATPGATASRAVNGGLSPAPMSLIQPAQTGIIASSNTLLYAGIATALAIVAFFILKK